MPGAVTFRIEGLVELDRALGQLKPAAGKAVLRRVGKKALEPVIEHARGLVPVDEGHLKRSLAVSTKLTRSQARQHRKAFGSDKASVELFAGAGGLAQATLREFGGDGNPPQPYLRPAWEANKAGVLATIRSELGDEIEKAARRAAAKAARLAARAAR